MSDLTAQQEQDAIKLAKHISAKSCYVTIDARGEFFVSFFEAERLSRALLSMHGRLEEAERLSVTIHRVNVQIEAELTETRKALELEHSHSDELSSESEDHAFLVAKVKRVTRHVAGDAGIHSGREFDSLMADVRDLATVTINPQTQVADTLQRAFTEARKAISESDMLRSLAYSELEEVRRQLEIAPHGERCASHGKPHRCDFPIDQSCRYAIAGCDTHRPGWRNCNCWKSQIAPTETKS